MEAESKIAEVLEHYRRVLALSREQLTALEGGRIEELPAILQRKADTVEAAGLIMAELKASPDDAVQSAVREGLGSLAELMTEVVEIEDRCQKLCAPPEATPPPAPPRSQVASLYQQRRK